MVVSREFMERRKIVGVMSPSGSKEIGFGSEAREKTSHMVGSTAHQTECLLGPTLQHAPPWREVFRRTRNVVATQNGPPGPGRLIGHKLTIFGVSCDVPKSRD